MRRRDVAKELDGPVARRLLSGAIPARFAYLALDVTPRAIPDTAERGSGTRGETTEVTLLLVAFVPGGSWGVPGIDPDEVQRRFATAWTLLSSGSEPAMDHNGKNPARHYLFQRAS